MTLQLNVKLKRASKERHKRENEKIMYVALIEERLDKQILRSFAL